MTLAERVALALEQHGTKHFKLMGWMEEMRTYHALAKLVRAGEVARNACYECMPITDAWDAALTELAAALGVEDSE